MVLELLGRDNVYMPGQVIGDYTILQCMGEGKYGICYIVCKDNERYIFKQLKKSALRKIGAKANYEELLLSNIIHGCIPKFIEKIRIKNLRGYILELKEGKNFEEIVFHDSHVFERREIYDIGMHLISVLKYLHRQGIVHRDIRLPNVIYDNGSIYLVDFGLARWADSKYKYDIDFAYLGDFLIHLFYTSCMFKDCAKKPWFEELDLYGQELAFLKKLMGLEPRYADIYEVERDFLSMQACLEPA